MDVVDKKMDVVDILRSAQNSSRPFHARLELKVNTFGAGKFLQLSGANKYSSVGRSARMGAITDYAG